MPAAFSSAVFPQPTLESRDGASSRPSPSRPRSTSLMGRLTRTRSWAPRTSFMKSFARRLWSKHDTVRRTQDIQGPEDRAPEPAISVDRADRAGDPDMEDRGGDVDIQGAEDRSPEPAMMVDGVTETVDRAGDLDVVDRVGGLGANVTLESLLGLLQTVLSRRGPGAARHVLENLASSELGQAELPCSSLDLALYVFGPSGSYMDSVSQNGIRQSFLHGSSDQRASTNFRERGPELLGSEAPQPRCMPAASFRLSILMPTPDAGVNGRYTDPGPDPEVHGLARRADSRHEFCETVERRERRRQFQDPGPSRMGRAGRSKDFAAFDQELCLGAQGPKEPNSPNVRDSGEAIRRPLRADPLHEMRDAVPPLPLCPGGVEAAGETRSPSEAAHGVNCPRAVHLSRRPSCEGASGASSPRFHRPSQHAQDAEAMMEALHRILNGDALPDEGEQRLLSEGVPGAVSRRFRRRAQYARRADAAGILFRREVSGQSERELEERPTVASCAHEGRDLSTPPWSVAAPGRVQFEMCHEVTRPGFINSSRRADVDGQMLHSDLIGETRRALEERWTFDSAIGPSSGREVRYSSSVEAPGAMRSQVRHVLEFQRPQEAHTVKFPGVVLSPRPSSPASAPGGISYHQAQDQDADDGTLRQGAIWDAWSELQERQSRGMSPDGGYTFDSSIGSEAMASDEDSQAIGLWSPVTVQFGPSAWGECWPKV